MQCIEICGIFIHFLRESVYAFGGIFGNLGAPELGSVSVNQDSMYT